MLGGEGFRMKKVVNLGSGEVHVPQRPKRRRFSADYKLKILAEAEACKGTGQVAAMLRREGLYYSTLKEWRDAREAGALNALEPARTGPKPKERNPLEGRVKELEKEKKALERKLKRAEWLLEISKKGAELMEKMALGHQLETDDSE
jgi:transposase-like protein